MTINKPKIIYIISSFSVLFFLFACSDSKVAQYTLLQDLSGVWSEDNNSFVEFQLTGDTPYMRIGFLAYKQRENKIKITNISFDAPSIISFKTMSKEMNATVQLTKLTPKEGVKWLNYSIPNFDMSTDLEYFRDKL